MCYDKNTVINSKSTNGYYICNNTIGYGEPEAHSEPSQTSKMQFMGKKVNC